MEKLCGAKARSNNLKPCRKPAMANGRCRYHGGMSTGVKTSSGKLRQKMASWKHGQYSAEALVERHAYRKFVQQCKKLLMEQDDK
jgi:hypothetical protein